MLSKQLKLLEQADYLKIEKRSHLGRPRTWLSLSSQGLSAFKGHVAALKQIVGDH
ncbi:MAG: transcriptional regulator [Gammaproteobacteria bacterium]|nr:transcriptional regulator [Gammaproteobacteria bacterium]